MKKVSLIVAAYNVEKYIARCLDSLTCQTLLDIEVIVVNDASTDRTLEIINQYSGRDSRIHIIDKKTNEGLSLARNTGLRQAEGEYVAFVDGDDFVEADTYGECCRLADKAGADCVVFASVYDRLDGSRMVMPLNSSKDYYGSDEKNLYFAEMLGTQPQETSDYAIGFAPWGRIYRRETLISNNICFISERKLIYEDLMFSLNVTPHLETVCLINKPFYHYCENEGSLTKRASAERYQRVSEMYDYIKKQPKYHHIFENSDLLLRFQRTIFSYVRLCIIQLSHDDAGKEALKEILGDSMTREVIGCYPVMKLPFKKRVFAFLTKHKCRGLLWELIKAYKN